MKNVLVKVFTGDEVLAHTAQFCATAIEKALRQKPVLLLLSGGSALPMYQELGELLVANMPDLSRLTISLIDERFVEYHSPDNNALQLQEKGIVNLFTKAGAKWLPYLSEKKADGEVVASRVSHEFENILDDGATLIVLAGMGDDAHTAGLLPTNDKTTIQQLYHSNQLVAYYAVPADAPNPYRQRLTSTPKLIERADQVIVYATGEKKQNALCRLVAGTEEIPQCPVIALRHSRSDVFFFTDQAV